MTSLRVQFDLDQRGVATVTLDSPATFNGLDFALTNEFIAVLSRCENARVICLQGRGKHFCAGADVKSLSDARPVPLLKMLRYLNNIPRPTVGLIHGACIGGGVALAACCDIVVAEETSFFSIPEVRLGIPPVALLPYLVAAIGGRQLRRFLLSGERFGASEAANLGLVHRVCPTGDLRQSAETIVEGLLRGGPLAIANCKRSVMQATSVDLSEEEEELLNAEITRHAASPEAREGMQAFLQKHPPSWQVASTQRQS
jgi:methylglutaconyl-CoA hydratase